MPPKKAPTAKTAAKVPAKPAGKPQPVNKSTGTRKPGQAQAAGAKKTTTGAKSKAGANTGKQQQKPVEKKWTKQDEAARKIQALVRGFLARRLLLRKKKEKQDYEDLMERLEKEAFVKLVKMEQEEMEKQRLKEEEERRRKREEAKRRKRILEAAFDGELDEVDIILHEVIDLDNKNDVGHDVIGQSIRNKHLFNMVECEDPNNNTPLSEASSGGHAETIKYLIEKGANPNSKGQFGRTPLYRAAFAGHMEACQVLLQSGADPRVYADDGQTPEHVASQPGVKELLMEWDINLTETLIAKLEADREIRAEADRKRREVETSKLENQVENAEADYKIVQKRLMKATEEMNKRITEHDTCVGEGFDRPELTIQAIHDAEAQVEIAKIDLEKARDALASIKLKLREKQMESREAMGENELPGLKVVVRELDDVLLRDVGNKIKDSGKWPLIIDPSSQAATFLRYRDTNYIQALSPKEMESERIRHALLGAIRFGKPLVLDMMEVDMFETCAMRFNEIQPGLMDMVMNKDILKEENYLKLVKKEDGDEYQKYKFIESTTEKFKFMIITKNPFPPSDLLDATYVIRVHIPT